MKPLKKKISSSVKISKKNGTVKVSISKEPMAKRITLR